jgi:hypothetical protein
MAQSLKTLLLQRPMQLKMMLSMPLERLTRSLSSLAFLITTPLELVSAAFA